MNNTTNKRFYTPQFSEKASVSVRRLAWAMEIPMTSTIDLIISELSTVFLSSVVCPKCKDKTKCSLCAFYLQARQQEEAALTAGV